MPETRRLKNGVISLFMWPRKQLQILNIARVLATGMVVSDVVSRRSDSESTLVDELVEQEKADA